MTDAPRVQRHLPPRWVTHMVRLESGPLELDLRSQAWVNELADIKFVDATFAGERRKTVIKVELTNRGKYALERERRGVDPYLVMT